jgi:PAS domain S-box-containing protein
MNGFDENTERLHLEVDELRRRLGEAEETLRAIRAGEVDAVLVNGPQGPQVYTLTGAESPYRFLIEQMQEGALSLGVDGLILYCNQRFSDLVSSPLEKVIGRQIQEFIDPPDRARYDALVRNQSDSGAKAEMRLLTADGATVPVYLSLSRYTPDDIEGLCATVTDLTEQKRNEEVIASEKLARLILDQATEAIVVTDETGKVIRANRVASDLAGQNILLQRFEEAFHIEPEPADDSPDSAAGWTAHTLLAAALKGEPIQRLEARLRHPGGKTFSIILGTASLTGSDGAVIGAVLALTDVTERKRAEEVVRQANEELRRANSDLEQFAYSASHDLQQPIRNVAIYSQLLQKRYSEVLDAEGLDYLSVMRAGALQMERLVRDLLDYTRVSAERDKNIATIDAGDAVEIAQRNLAEVIRETGTCITVDPLPLVKIGAVHLQQLFQNLLGNAIKYRSEKKPFIQVSSHKNGKNYVFSVRDNGIGIAPEYHEQIFGVFKRLHSEDKYAGTGIGLAICQRIVERYGGRIWVESDSREGSTFFFTIPN